MIHIEKISIIFFREFVIAMLIINWNPKAYWGLPFGILIGFLSETRWMTHTDILKNKNKNEEKDS